MTDHGQVHLERDERIFLGPRARTLQNGALAACVVGAAIAVIVGFATGEGFRRFFHAYLINFAFFLSLSLGALFFVLIQHATKAGWSAGLRRPAEVIAAALPFLAIGLLPLLVAVLAGGGELYPWARELAADTEHAASATGHSETHSEAADHKPGHGEGAHGANEGADAHGQDALIAHKRPYLNPAFFILRWVVFFAIWSGLALRLWRQSTLQDERGDSEITLGMQRLAPIGLVLFALTVTFAAFDLLMSLSPAWYSTIFGVYYFAGAFVGGVALLILMLMAMQRAGYLVRSITVEHYHDLGKLLFAFVFFWGYIAFSQYMLIWYASFPETTFWYAVRGATAVPEDMNAWTGVIVGLLFGHFIIPFVALLPRNIKRRRQTLAFWAVWMLVFHWIDLWWIVMPEMAPGLRLGIPELATFLAIGGLFLAAVTWNARRYRLIALHDPRLGEALGFENI